MVIAVAWQQQFDNVMSKIFTERSRRAGSIWGQPAAYGAPTTPAMPAVVYGQPPAGAKAAEREACNLITQGRYEEAIFHVQSLGTDALKRCEQ
mmetsp:Transcript_80124/g.183582  ORF Transcript_80124/g.183582 Transcript_80124/m.183582 type:complete len:93 (+) Transcript_80124:131-409(+)